MQQQSGHYGQWYRCLERWCWRWLPDPRYERWCRLKRWRSCLAVAGSSEHSWQCGCDRRGWSEAARAWRARRTPCCLQWHRPTSCFEANDTSESFLRKVVFEGKLSGVSYTLKQDLLSKVNFHKQNEFRSWKAFFLMWWPVTDQSGTWHYWLEAGSSISSHTWSGLLHSHSALSWSPFPIPPLWAPLSLILPSLILFALTASQNPARGSRQRCRLHQRGLWQSLGQRPGRYHICMYFR